ncbi:MAG TPA: SpoIIE family protein phosphatase [Spirochaetota bacterium]|nr:SpoIIE family protein phosphatase [Spirochaetota bacterium]
MKMEAVENPVKCSLLKSVEDEKISHEVIFKRAVSLYYVSDSHNIGEIAELFTGDRTIQAIGVVDDNGKAAGIVIRNELFSLIGQKFGRELYLNKSIRDVLITPATVYYKRNTFSVIDELADELKSEFNRFFILVDNESRYRGIISTSSLVLFLSEMMRRELAAARRIHSAIITGNIEISGERFEAAGSTVMAGETGGDFQYIKKIGEGKWFISLCDVSGKGLNAGLISVAVSSMYAVYDFSRGIGELIRSINSYINDLFGGEIFLTGVFMEFDENSGELTVYDMGHSMFYILRDGKAGTPSKQKENIPLGILKGAEPVKSCIRLEKGDVIISYTDGFPEQCNMSNESFGEQKLLSIVLKYRNSELIQVQRIIADEVNSWRIGNAQGDDMSLLLLRVK